MNATRGAAGHGIVAITIDAPVILLRRQSFGAAAACSGALLTSGHIPERAGVVPRALLLVTPGRLLSS